MLSRTAAKENCGYEVFVKFLLYERLLESSFNLLSERVQGRQWLLGKYLPTLNKYLYECHKVNVRLANLANLTKLGKQN